jgi:primase-polymerase (primpol)-like protein
MLVGETVEKIKIDTIPADLRMRRQWVLWRYGKMRSNGKREKPIFMPNGRPASVADPATWTTFAKACVA